MARRSKVFLTFGMLPPRVCPTCRSTLRSGTGIGMRERAAPEPGMLALCAVCLTWNVLTASLAYRTATSAEIEELDPEARRIAELSARHLADDGDGGKRGTH